MHDATDNAFLGALLGMAIGDALGAPAAGLTRDEVTRQFGSLDTYHAVASPDDEKRSPGEFTDETEIALCIVESMTANRGQIDEETAGMRMVHLAAGASRHWLQPAARDALDAAAESLSFVAPLDEDGPATGDVAARGVPIGLLHAVGRFDPQRLRADAETVTRLTHGGPAAFNATTAVAFAVRLAATGVPRERWATETAAFLGGGELAERLEALGQEAPTRPLSETIDAIGTGLVATESVPAAFAAAMATESFEEAVFAAVRAGGAADTIGALTGALAGAASGASGIPQALIDGLAGRIYVSLAAPWFHQAARQRAGQLIDLRPVHGPRPDMPPRQ